MSTNGNANVMNLLAGLSALGALMGQPQAISNAPAAGGTGVANNRIQKKGRPEVDAEDGYLKNRMGKIIPDFQLNDAGEPMQEERNGKLYNLPNIGICLADDDTAKMTPKEVVDHPEGFRLVAWFGGEQYVSKAVFENRLSQETDDDKKKADITAALNALNSVKFDGVSSLKNWTKLAGRASNTAISKLL